ncbi:hypothetical protein [uncultured Roseivirga sp.]|uniref:hypothetical protein n=1 Tax=uncultured Roseivirga sp. TaxID=543088 RepID=UPI0030D8CD15|tara:strand:- start:5632 stop:5910 length:279 start_codon:yes stop_codon:yes gene_type:complete
MSTEAAAAQAAIQQAIKASGAVVKIEANEFSRMLSKMDDGLVIEQEGKLFFKDYYKYSTSYKGFVFYCKSNEKISVPSRLEKINAKQIWVPQ